MKRIYCIILSLLVSFPAISKNTEFPGRALYVDVKHIELNDLSKQFKNVVIVDVRSKYEFDTLHIKNAQHISLRSKHFISSLKNLRNENINKKIVTYCNGKTCMKSYKAARKAQQYGIKNVVAYDAGIMDWAKANPSLSVLLGQSPLDPSKLISKSNFKKQLLPVNDFIASAQKSKNSLVLDARDPNQRDGISLFTGLEQRASLRDNEAMDKIIVEAAKQKKTMYIYDQAGKQIRWLMYRLEERGVKKYKFMKGGMKAYYKKLREEMTR